MMNKTKRPWLYAAVATVMLLGSCDAIADFLGSGPIAEFLGRGTDEGTDGGGGSGADNGTPVTVSDVRLDNQNIFILKDHNVQLKPTITLANVAVLWQSDNTSVATVDTNGKVTGGAEGTTKIRVAPQDGGNAAEVSVTVVDLDSNITTKDQWDAVFAAISRAPDGTSSNQKVYKLNITGNFGVAGRTTANITGTYRKVQLTGNGKVTLSSSGSIIQTAANQTYTFNGPTFVGRSDNDRSVVYLDSGSAEFLNGEISGNTTVYNGGGVYISNGTFSMSGGKISGNNTAETYGYGYGGGVYISSGTFSMKNGEISGNNASSSGGGVYVTGSNASFEMNNGSKISNNTARTGGGVSISRDTKMVILNGYISDNTATNCGGGVFVGEGTLQLRGGIIKGNSAGGSSGGGGVYVSVQNGAGIFSNAGCTIYGDTDSATSHQPGSEVNTAVYSTRNVGQNGHAVMFHFAHPEEDMFFYRNKTLTENVSATPTEMPKTGNNVGYLEFDGRRG